MQPFARVQRGGTSIPALVDDGELLDLRPLVSDITPETIASGVLSKVNSSVPKPILTHTHTWRGPSCQHVARNQAAGDRIKPDAPRVSGRTRMVSS